MNERDRGNALSIKFHIGTVTSKLLRSAEHRWLGWNEILSNSNLTVSTWAK